MSKKVDVTIKKMSSNEPNVSQRHVTYDVYHDGKYHTTFKDINDAMDHKEKMQKEELEIDEAVLSISQRQKRAQIMRRFEAKMVRSREIAKKKMAPKENIKKRAYAQARQIVRRKVAGKRGAEYEKLGPSEKMAIDRAVEGKQKLIKKIALRLIPKVKSAEQQRLSTFMKGQAIKSHGQPEGNTKESSKQPESSGTSSVKESFNSLFAEQFPPMAERSQRKQPEETNDKTSSKTGGKKVKGNQNIIQYSKFDEERDCDSTAYKAISKKAKKSGLSEDVLGEVYDRGMDAWVEETGVTQQQYAFARVNSYINQGKSYFNEDADLHEGFSNYTFTLKPGDKTKVLSGDHRGKRGTVVSSHEGGSVYTIKHNDGSTMKHHISTLEEPINESNNTPYVKPHIENGQARQSGWKASNKHGKVKYFGMDFKKSAEKHAGIDESYSHLTTAELRAHGEAAVRKGDKQKVRDITAEVKRRIENKTGKAYVAPEKVSAKTASDYERLTGKKVPAHRVAEETDLDEGIKEKIKGVIRREKSKDMPLVQTRRDYAMGKAGDAYEKGETRKGNQYNAWAERSRKKEGVKSSNPTGKYRTKTSDYTTEENQSIAPQVPGKSSKRRMGIQTVERDSTPATPSNDADHPTSPQSSHNKHAQIKKKIIDEEGNVQIDPKKRLIGTDDLVKAYKKDTPGQCNESLNESFNIAFASGVGVTLTAGDLGMRTQGGFALHPSVIAEMKRREEEIEEEVKSADKEPVVIPSHKDEFGNTIPAKTVMRKKSKTIIKSGNVHDGEND